MSDYTQFPGHAWDPAFKALIDAETYYVAQTWSRFVSLAPPPPDALGECSAVIKAGDERDAREEEIAEQSWGLQLQLWPLIEVLKLPDVTKENWAPIPRSPYPARLPKTWELLRAGLWDMQCGLYALKQRFNRGRPIHTCGSQIGDTSVVMPGHPAYPGGHAAQCHAAVLLLEVAIKRMGPAPLNPPDLAHLLRRMLHAAERVADNRVIAGIHFPSDSVAGRQLALQYVPILMCSDLFDAVVRNAADELTAAWPKKP